MPNIRTLGELNDAKSDSGNPSDDEDRQGFFVGGSERSGQQVLGPNDGDMVADRLFETAQRRGANAISSEEAARFRHDGILGHRLGQQGQASEQVLRGDGAARVHIIFWQDGFSVDDGPLRSFQDPASMEFLRALNSQQVPAELQQKFRGRHVDVHLERRATPYEKPKAKPFASGGQRLGAVVPEVVTLDGPSGSTKRTEEESKNLVEEAQKCVGLKEGEPTGRIQIRQPSGEKLIGVFNPSHLIEDVRSFVVAAVPELAFQPFQLHSTFPNQLIADESKTVKEADVLNAVVVIKYVN